MKTAASYGNGSHQCTCSTVQQTNAGQIIHNLINVLGQDEHYMLMEHADLRMLEIKAGSSLVNGKAVRWKTALKWRRSGGITLIVCRGEK